MQGSQDMMKLLRKYQMDDRPETLTLFAKRDTSVTAAEGVAGMTAL